MRPIFLSVEIVLRLHQHAIARDGGDAGLRDLGLLESAIAQPHAMFGGEFLHKDLAEMAAAYAFHLAMNHAFIDGNKRVAALAAGVFLDLNGADLICAERAFEDAILRVASSELEKPGLTDFFRANIRMRSSQA